MPSTRCALDGRCLDGERTGIGVFTAEIVRSWPGELEIHRRSDHRWPWHLQVWWAVRRSGTRYLSTESLIVPAMLGRRATVVIHDLTPLLHPTAHTQRTRWAQRLFLGLACRRVGAVVVPGDATRADLVAMHPGVASRVHVVPYAWRELPPSAPLPAEVGQRFVLHTGTHEPRKNVTALVEGFLAHVPQPWRLVLAGKQGWLDEEAARALDSLVAGSEGRVVRLGFVSDEVLSGLYAGADLFAYPSSAEGFGLPVVEAMQCGVPVVISDAAAVVEAAGGAASIVPLGPELADALGLELARLLAVPAERDALVARGHARAAAFSWAATAAGVQAAVQTTPGA